MWLKKCVQVERKCVLELRVLRPGMWFDFVDSVQAWQGQPDVIQLAPSKKIWGADLFFFLPCCTADWAASCWLQLTVLSGSDRGGGGFVLSESTPVLPSGHAHMDECTHTNTYAHACEHGIHQAHARWTSHTYSNSGELHMCEYKRNWNADAWRQERWEICQTFQPCTIHTQKRKYSAKLNVRHQSFIWNYLLCLNADTVFANAGYTSRLIYNGHNGKKKATGKQHGSGEGQDPLGNESPLTCHYMYRANGKGK